VDAERVWKSGIRQLLDWREAFLEERELLQPFDRERPDFAVLGHIRQQIQCALRERQPVRDGPDTSCVRSLDLEWYRMFACRSCSVASSARANQALLLRIVLSGATGRP
jgi:hypothetical protein